MKIFIFFIFFTFISILASANEIEVIELHETKTLDQMVLDNSSELEVLNTKIDNEDNEEEKNEIFENSGEVEEKEIELNNFWSLTNKESINNYLNNANNIKSQILEKELFSLLEIANLDLDEKENRQIFFSIVNYFYKNGNITKSYDLISKKDLQNYENINFYNMIKLNYLLSTFQLDRVCDLKDEFSKEINFKNFLIEKIDIFCLILNNKYSEAELLNSILLETEANIDNNFQQLYSAIISNNNELENIDIKFSDPINKDLIFLYSSMLRIAELPLNPDFLKVDSKNLAIPIILNQSSPIDLRIKAANDSFLGNNISIESLAALYQSVDFNSSQLNNPTETIEKFSNNIEMLMAFHFQLINIQIFPSERIKALMNFWDFSKLNNLEEISYSLSYKIVQSIELSAENLEFSPQIATSYIYNKNYEMALEWINFYEGIKGIDEKIAYVKILYNLYSAAETQKIIETITSNSEVFSKSKDKKVEELMFVLFSTLQNNLNQSLSENFSNIYDDRLMPSTFIIENLNDSIQNNNNDIFLMYSIVSLNNKDWNEIHPQHLKILLSGFISYKNGELIREIIIEILKHYKIL